MIESVCFVVWCRVNSNLSFCFIKYSTPIPVLYSAFETSLFCTVSCQHTKVHLPTIQTHTICMFPWKLCHIYPSRNFSVSSFTSFSNTPPFHHFMPFRNIFCSTFTIWFNKYNQNFTVTHNSHSFWCSTHSRLDILYQVCVFSLEATAESGGQDGRQRNSYPRQCYIRDSVR